MMIRMICLGVDEGLDNRKLTFKKRLHYHSQDKRKFIINVNLKLTFIQTLVHS